jgi:hypothetical protein
MLDTAKTDHRSTDGTPAAPRFVGALKIVVVVMGLLIVAGLATVVGRVIYLASSGSGAPAGPVRPEARLTLPSGAIVRQTTLSGDRVAVHYDSPAGGGIVILDLTTGRTLNRIELSPEAPRN